MKLVTLFWVFFKIDLLSFGGVTAVLPFLEKMVVKENRWIDHDQFLRAYSVCQFIPGPNMAMAPLIGFWVSGYLGFIAAFLGMYSGPVILFAGVSAIYRHSRNLVLLKRIELSLRPLVFGLVVASAGRYWWTQSAGLVPTLWISRALAFCITALGLFAYQKKRIGPVGLMTIMACGWCGIYFALLHLH